MGSGEVDLELVDVVDKNVREAVGELGPGDVAECHGPRVRHDGLSQRLHLGSFTAVREGGKGHGKQGKWCVQPSVGDKSTEKSG